MPFKPVGIDENNHFPTRVEARLTADFDAKGDAAAAQTAAQAYAIPVTAKAAPSGVAPLDSGSRVPEANLPVGLAATALADTYATKPTNGARAVGQGELVINVKNYGALGNMTAATTGNGADDTTAITAAFTAASTAIANGLSPTVEFPQVVFGYRTTSGVTLPDNVNIRMWSPIVYDGAAATALTIGSGARQNRRTHRIAVLRAGISSWANEADEGVRIYTHYYSDITIAQATFFTVGVNLWGKTSGFVYNKVHLGHLGDNKIGLNMTGSLGGWCNQNKFFGGSWSAGSTTYPTTDRVGVRITSSDGTYDAHNANTFYGPSFELHDSGGGAGAGEGVPILIENGSQNTFRDVRNEQSSPTVIRTTGTSQHNRVFVEWNSIGNTQVVDDQGTYPSSKVVQGSTPIVAESTRLLAQWTALHKKACYYNGSTTVHVPGLVVGTSGTTPAEAMAQTALVLNSNYLEVPNSRHIGVFLDTSIVKRFTVVTDHDVGFGGRLHVRAYDSAGTVLTSTDPAAPYVKSISNSGFTYGTSFGGSYSTGSDSTTLPSFGRYFAVGANVDRVFVAVGGGSAALRLRGLSIYTPDAGHCSTMLLGAHRSTDDVRNYGTTFPTAGTWEQGRTILNDTPTLSGPTGWQCTTAGTPGTWKDYGAPAGVVSAGPTEAGIVGFSGWAFDPTPVTTGNTVGTAGTLTGTRIRVPVDTSVTNLELYIGAAGVGLTTGQCFAALYTTAGALLGVSADQSVGWTSTGLKTMAIAAGPVALTAGYYDIAWWSNGTTQPGVMRGQSATSVNLKTTAATSRIFTADTGLTTTAPATRATKAAVSVAYWAAVS